MLGNVISAEKIEGVETAAAIMGRPCGAVITPAMLAKLIKHPRGLFRGVRCPRILFCTGYNAVQHRMTEALLDDLEDFDLTASVWPMAIGKRVRYASIFTMVMSKRNGCKQK